MNKNFWEEVELRASNNYGDVRVYEEAGANVNKAIDDILTDIKETLLVSREAIQTKAGVALNFEVDLGI